MVTRNFFTWAFVFMFFPQPCAPEFCSLAFERTSTGILRLVEYSSRSCSIVLSELARGLSDLDS